MITIPDILSYPRLHSNPSSSCVFNSVVFILVRNHKADLESRCLLQCPAEVLCLIQIPKPPNTCLQNHSVDPIRGKYQVEHLTTCSLAFYPLSPQAMVLTQEQEAEAEASLGPGWRKIEVLKDGNVRKTPAKYWNPEGEEVAVKEVKRLLALAAGGLKKPKKVARKAKAAEVESLVECGECSITFSTTSQQVVHMKSFHQAKVTMEEETKVARAPLPPPGLSPASPRSP